MWLKPLHYSSPSLVSALADACPCSFGGWGHGPLPGLSWMQATWCGLSVPNRGSGRPFSPWALFLPTISFFGYFLSDSLLCCLMARRIKVQGWAGFGSRFCPGVKSGWGCVSVEACLRTRGGKAAVLGGPLRVHGVAVRRVLASAFLLT